MRAQLTLPAYVQNSLKRLNDAGYLAYVVGGAVRDHLLGLCPMDYDIATSAMPEQIMAVFSDVPCIPTGMKHGTVTVVVEKHPLEITVFRKDGNYTDHRHPTEVTFVRNLKDDIARRDFTINGLAYHPQEGIVDLCGGVADLQAGIIRCIGDPLKRYEEDALRILRALRFASTYGFMIEQKTSDALLLKQPLLKAVAQERCTHEFTRFLSGKHAVTIWNQYSEVCSLVIDEAVKELVLPEGLFAIGDCFEVRFALLLYLTRLPNDKCAMILRHMKYPNATQKKIKQLLQESSNVMKDARSMTYGLNRLCEEGVRLLLLFQLRAQVISKESYQSACLLLDELVQKNVCYSLKQLAVNGSDLLASFSIPSTWMKELLAYLLDKVMMQQLPNEKSALLHAASIFIQCHPQTDTADTVQDH